MRDLFPDSILIREVMSRRAVNDSIWSYAETHGFTVLSKDADFLDTSEERGHSSKLIWIRTRNSPVAVVESLLRVHNDEITAFGQNPDRGIIELP